MPKTTTKLIKVQSKAHEKVQITLKKSAFSSSDTTDQKSNVMMTFSPSSPTFHHLYTSLSQIPILNNGKNPKITGDQSPEDHR